MIDRRFKTSASCLTLTFILVLFSFLVTPDGVQAAESDSKGQAAYLRPLAPGKAGAPAFKDGRLEFDRDQTIAILGGTNALEMQRYGYFETLLAIIHPDIRLRVRNMAWQADTVYRQQRPRHFFQPAPIRYPGDTDGREPIPVDTIIFWMGQSESLEGMERLDDFRTAYIAMLDQLKTITPRIVLVTPVPFEKTKEIPLDVTERNQTLAAYARVIGEVGKERELPVVYPLSSVYPVKASGSGGQTRNGMHLGELGCWNAAFALMNAMTSQPTRNTPVVNASGVFDSASAEAVRQHVLKKDDLWYRYWRPTNWAFLYGNRSLQPSSRDHIDSKKRWFPKEIASITPLIDQLDEVIHQAGREHAFAPRSKATGK